jgi:hypothetical protein
MSQYSTTNTQGYVLYLYDSTIAARTRLESSAWICYGEFTTREEAVYEAYCYRQHEPSLSFKINKEGIFG